jgi:hypothetical protein
LQFCEGVAPGEASAKDCLEEQQDQPGFSLGCRSALRALIARRSRGCCCWQPPLLAAAASVRRRGFLPPPPLLLACWLQRLCGC